MPVYDTVEQAIKAIRDPQLLAEVASVILRGEHHPELVISGTTGDRGRDAVVRLGIWGAEVVLIQYSIADRWSRKVDSELARYRRDPTLPRRMMYVTNRVTSPAAVERKQKAAKGTHGVELAVLDYGWLWPRLQREYRGLAEELLGVRPKLPTPLLDAPTRRAELVQRIPGFSAPIIETASHRRLHEAIASHGSESSPRVVLLVGRGGLGKTRAALDSIPAGMPSFILQTAQRFDRDAVGALDPYSPGVLVLDDAHRIGELNGVRLLLNDSAWRGWLIVMTLRPGYAEDVLDRAGVQVDETVEIGFAELTRREAAALLEGDPYRITAPDVANHLLQLARGSPLMLHLGAEAVLRRNLSARGQAELLRTYASRLLRSLPTPVHGDLVAIAAVLGGLSLPRHLASVRRLHPSLALPDLRAALVDLADAGLGLFIDDTFTVAPDSIAPIIVLDALLRSAGARLRLADLSPELDTERAAVLPTLAAAAVYGRDEDREAVRAFAVRIPGPGTSAPELAAILREAGTYASALPDDTQHVLAETIRLHADALRAEPRLATAAATAARELVGATLARGLPLLLSVVALDPRTRRGVTDSPAAILIQLLERSPASFSSPGLTQRAVQGLGAIRDWLSEDDSSIRKRVALRASLMLVAIGYEWFGPAAADAMAIQLGTVLSPADKAHRDAVTAAATFAADLIARADTNALDELASAYPALLGRAAGLYPGLSQLPDWHRQTIRRATTIIRAAILSSWDRLPIAVRLRCFETDSNRRLAARAHADAELEPFATIFTITPAGRLGTQEWSRQLQRAQELGKTIGIARALDLAAAAQDLADEHLTPSGVGHLLGAAAQHATREQAIAAITRLRASPRLQPWLGAFLVGAAQGPGLTPKTWHELATDQHAAPHVARVLDFVSEAQHARLLDELIQQPSSHRWLANQIRTSTRYDASAKAERLLTLAEATDEDCLPSVLEQFGTLPSSIGVPRNLRDRLLVQIIRAARSGPLDRSSPGNLSDAYALVVGWGGDEWLQVLRARREAMLSGVPDLVQWWDLVPDRLAPALQGLSEQQRDHALPQIARWVTEPSGPGAWRVDLGAEELIVRIGAGRPALTEIVATWCGADAAGRARALRMLAPLAARGAVMPALAAIVARTEAPEEDLVTALTAPPMDWAGDLADEYRTRAQQLRSGLTGASQRARHVADIAAADLERLAAEEQERTQQQRESYDP